MPLQRQTSQPALPDDTSEHKSACEQQPDVTYQSGGWLRERTHAAIDLLGARPGPLAPAGGLLSLDHSKVAAGYA